MNARFLFSLYLLFLITFNLTSQESKGWIIEAENTEKYYSPTMGNGMIGIIPEKNSFKIDKIVLNGVYDKYNNDVDVILQSINFLASEIRVDNKPIHKNLELQSNWEQSLNMKNGIMTTSFIFDKKVKISYEVLALRHLPYCGMINFHVKALADVNITGISALTGSASANINKVYFKNYGEGMKISSATASSPTGKVTLAAANVFLFENEEHIDIVPTIQETWNRNDFQKLLKKGEDFSYSLIGATFSSEHVTDPINEAIRMTQYAYMEGKERLIQRHKEAWANLWESDIIIEGNIQDQVDVRFALFNLYSFARSGTQYSIGPMGLSGTGYNGHIFWDTEIWMYPGLLLLHPEIGHSLMEYRYKRLEAAKENAFMHGYKGAMYPWESALSGGEETPTFALTGPFEHHISADVALAMWNYYLVTKDKYWLESKGYPVIKEIADFWISRAELNKNGEYEIKNVVCADEYAENVDNNAFTNAGAIKALEIATKAATILNEPINEKWNEIAEKIVILELDNGVTREHGSYNGERIKQADVNLLTYPLATIKEEDQIRKNLEFYRKVVNPNGPAMTHSVYSIIYSQLGEPEMAYQLFRQALDPIKRPPYGVLAEGAKQNNPYFATAAGGLLQAVINGFGGLRITEDGIIQTKSKLPKAWKKLTITGVGIEEKTFTVEQ